MKSISQIILEEIEERKHLFVKEYGKENVMNKELFIKWYFEHVEAPYDIIINDLSNYILFISEDTIVRYLNN